MLRASYYAGCAFTKSYVGYVHAVAHSLGGEYNVPHGLANAILLPFVLEAYGKMHSTKNWQTWQSLSVSLTGKHPRKQKLLTVFHTGHQGHEKAV